MTSRYAIGEHFEAFIQEQIQRGRYANASEVVRDGLRVLEDRERLLQARVEALRTEVERGAKSGPAINAAAVFDEVRQHIAAHATTMQSRRR